MSNLCPATVTNTCRKRPRQRSYNKRPQREIHSLYTHKRDAITRLTAYFTVCQIVQYKIHTETINRLYLSHISASISRPCREYTLKHRLTTRPLQQACNGLNPCQMPALRDIADRDSFRKIDLNGVNSGKKKKGIRGRDTFAYTNVVGIADTTGLQPPRTSTRLLRTCPACPPYGCPTSVINNAKLLTVNYQ